MTTPRRFDAPRALRTLLLVGSGLVGGLTLHALSSPAPAAADVAPAADDPTVQAQTDSEVDTPWNTPQDAAPAVVGRTRGS
ncbi:hypothetical protein [Deinococcus koreensis]|uniref:hypothetical protein n=1 Tax=Deinococcus koreensis TaxID=2054903 RepID=UPI0013FDFB7B|nr:hypothetical protein [Deinococcus koreensis]